MNKNEDLPVVTCTVSSGWPETDLIWQGQVYRYRGGLRWSKEIECPYCEGTAQSKAGGECGFCDNGMHVVGT